MPSVLAPGRVAVREAERRDEAAEPRRADQRQRDRGDERAQPVAAPASARQSRRASSQIAEPDREVRLGRREREPEPEAGGCRPIPSPRGVRGREPERGDAVDLTEEEERVGSAARDRQEQHGESRRPRRGASGHGPGADRDPHRRARAG